MVRTLDTRRIGSAIPEQVGHLLEQAIIVGRLSPRARLTELEVAATYGISRSPVREAMRLLEQNGLVQRSVRRGVWVSPLSLADFDEVYGCRIPLEGLAAEAAAQSPHAPAMRGRFDALLARLGTAKADADAPGFFNADVEGSALIYTLAANATLRRLLATLEKQALRYRFFAYEQSPKVIQLSIEATSVIYDRICKGDAQTARRLTERLIDDIRRTMRAVVAAAFPEAEG